MDGWVMGGWVDGWMDGWMAAPKRAAWLARAQAGAAPRRPAWQQLPRRRAGAGGHRVPEHSPVRADRVRQRLMPGRQGQRQAGD
jgi:hypothetical protein